MSQGITAQINVRLPRDLKESGDMGLRELGLSPSDAVRTLWTRLSQSGAGLSSVRDFLCGDFSEVDEDSPIFTQSPVAEGWRLVSSSIAMLGIETTGKATAEESLGKETVLPESDGDLIAEALEERMQARGLM